MAERDILRQKYDYNCVIEKDIELLQKSQQTAAESCSQ